MKQIIYIIIILLSILFLMFYHTATAESPLQEITYNKDMISQIIGYYAHEYNISEKVMNKVIACESTYNHNAIGDGGKSFGLSQIHLPSWGGNITKEQATNPYFAVEFLADKLSKGQGRLWTCYKKLV